MRATLVPAAHLLILLLGVPEPAVTRLSYGAVELRWQAPPACPDAAWIDARIRSDLATVPDATDPLAILIDDDVVATADGRFALSSRTTSATGSEQRRWVADACTTLAEIAAAQGLSAIDQSIVQALPPLDPNANLVRTPVPVPDEPPVPPSLPEAIDDAPPVTKPRPRLPRRRVHVGLRPTIGVEIGGLPSVGPTMGLAAAVLTRRVRSELSLAYFMPRYTGGIAGAGAVLQLVTVAARVCPRVVLPRLELAVPCVGLEVGGALGRGVGVAEPRRDTVLWAAVQLGPMLGVRVHPRFTVFADAHAAFSLGRPTFALRELGTVWRGSTGVRVLAGLEIRLR